METVTCDQAFLQSLANKTNTCLLYPKKLSKMQLIQNTTVWQIISYNTGSWHLLKLHPSRDENVSLLLKGIEGNKSLKSLPLFLKRLFGYFYLSMPLNLWQMRWMVPGYTHYAHTNSNQAHPSRSHLMNWFFQEYGWRGEHSSQFLPFYRQLEFHFYSSYTIEHLDGILC